MPSENDKSYYKRGDKKMKGIMPVLATVAVLAVVLLLFRGPGSLVNDCARLNEAAAKVPYSLHVQKSITITAGSGSGSFGRLVVIEKVPSYAKIEVARALMVFNGNAFGRPTERQVGITHGQCTDNVLIAYEGNPAVGWAMSDGGTVDYTNFGGTYTVIYDVTFIETIPVPIMPTPAQETSVSQEGREISMSQEGRIPILSDILNGIAGLIVGIIAFISTPFLSP